MAIDEQLMSPKMLTLWRKLRQLATYDSGQTVFGSKLHKYRFFPCLTISDLDNFQQQYRVVLPEDYQEFLTQIGNGGAGPEYGLHRLQDSVGEHDRVLLSRPWPHQTQWNLKYSDFVDYQDYDNIYSSDEHVQGALSISDIGCGHRTLLVISGDEQGTIWQDFRAGDEGIIPMRNGLTGEARISFSDWYEAWLDKNLVS